MASQEETVQQVELVTSVRRGRAIIVAPPIEPISGCMRAVPETEILRSYAKSRPHAYAVSEETIENFVQLPDKAFIAVSIKCDEPEELHAFLKAREIWTEIQTTKAGTSINALLDLPSLIHICSPIRFSGLKIEEDVVPQTFPKISTPFRTEIAKLEAQTLPDEVMQHLSSLPKNSLTPVEVVLATSDEKEELKVNLKALGLWVRSGNGTSTNMQAMVNIQTVNYLTTFGEVERLSLARRSSLQNESDLAF